MPDGEKQQGLDGQGSSKDDGKTFHEFISFPLLEEAAYGRMCVSKWAACPHATFFTIKERKSSKKSKN